VCRQNGIRLIPLFNCLGHQSWAKNTGALLKKHPEFDETPQIPADNKGIYCRICDWHYELRDDYPSVRFFQQQGFRVLPSTWNRPNAAAALVRCARQDATKRMLGVLFTGWSAGGNGERLMAALKGREIHAGKKDTAKQVAATIRAGLDALAAPTNKPTKNQ
jgi:hypothetical protein